MFAILDARFLAPDVKLFRVRAPRVARRQQPGQFVIVRTHERGERIPLTIAVPIRTRARSRWSCRASARRRS